MYVPQQGYTFSITYHQSLKKVCQTTGRSRDCEHVPRYVCLLLDALAFENWVGTRPLNVRWLYRCETESKVPAFVLLFCSATLQDNSAQPSLTGAQCASLPRSPPPAAPSGSVQTAAGAGAPSSTSSSVMCRSGDLETPPPACVRVT